MSTHTPLVEVAALSKTFEGTQALRDVSLSVNGGEIVALVGHNGSGKSTLIKVLAGIHHPDPGGRVVLATDGEHPIDLHFIHQELGLVPTLSTIENFDIAQPTGGLRGIRIRRHAEVASVLRHLEGFDVDIDLDAPVSELSAADRTIIAIARALASWRSPRGVLVLDEPTASLHRRETLQLFDVIRQVVARGAGVIFVSHILEEVLEIADRVVVLRDGEKVFDAPRTETDQASLVRLIAGEDVKQVADRATTAVDGPSVLRVANLGGGNVEDVSFAVKAGEVLGVGGLNGSGREHLAELLFGLRQRTGDVDVAESAVPHGSPMQAIRRGVALVPAERRTHAIVETMSVRENLMLSEYPMSMAKSWWLDTAGERRSSLSWLRRLDVRPLDAERPIAQLSGGNQQKVVIAKWLRGSPRVLLLDEPTQGVDIGAKAGIYAAVLEAAKQGAAVVICSSDSLELAEIADRVVVLRNGRRTAEFVGGEITESRVTEACLA
jgi:ABC-type sugar transport system ATPase subunit